MRKKYVTIWIATVLTVTALAGCAGSSSSQNRQEESDSADVSTNADESAEESPEVNQEATVVKGARVFVSPPYNYNDDDGNQIGYETEVIKAAFDLLPQYELQLIDTSTDELFTGLQSGIYDFAFKTAWYTEDRAQTFIYPEQASAATTVGLLIRSEDADQITDFKSFSEFGGKLVPLAPSNAQYDVVVQWNEENPDYPIELEAADSDTSEAISWVLEGRYDGHIYTGHYYQNNIVAEDGAYHAYADQLTWIYYQAFPTYPMFTNDNQELADAYDKAMVQLSENGTLAEIQERYFGGNIEQYLGELAETGVR